MILQALSEYYQRKETPIPEGFEIREIPFLLVISPEGDFLNLEDTSEPIGGRRTVKKFIVPRDRHKTGPKAYEIPNVFWDHYGFILGHPKNSDERSKQMAKKQKESFLSLVAIASEEFPDSPAFRAVSLFYENGEWKKAVHHDNWPNCADRKGCNLTFKVEGIGLVTEMEEVKVLARSRAKQEPKRGWEKGGLSANMLGPCLITGEHGDIARKTTATPIAGSLSNAKLVSFQKNSGYDSYGREQAANAPISIRAEFLFTSALKTLLAKESTNKLLSGSDTVLFWAERDAQRDTYDLEVDFSWFFADPPKDNPDRGVRAVRALYEAVHSGKVPVDEAHRFYVLGLAPNAARIAIRFWKTGTIGEFAERIKWHFDDFEIEHGPQEPDYLTLNQILRSTAFEYKLDNVPPNLGRAVVGSVLDGTPYPITLAQQCIRRIRAERHVTRARAAILKAFINRQSLYRDTHRKEEMTVSIDRTNTSPGYRLGRLFAVLEKIQEEANPGINATIRDRFYGAASSSPVAVFPQLIKLKNHHLAKLDNPGRKVNFEKEIGEIFCEVKDFPAHLSMEEQARFAIGYYHQRQSVFKK